MAANHNSGRHLKFLDTLVKYLRLRAEGIDLATKIISRRGSEIPWAGSWFFFFFYFFFPTLYSASVKVRIGKWWVKHTTVLCQVTFSSIPSAPGHVEGASRSVRFFANNAWLMAASWSFLRRSVQPRNWPPSKPAGKMTVLASGFSLTGQRYVHFPEGDYERGIRRKRRPPKLMHTEGENRTKWSS